MTIILSSILLALSALLSVHPVSAHFDLKYPTVRGNDEDAMGTGPCGGFSSPTADRTAVSTESLSVEMEMGHDQSAVQILLGLGDDPGSNFNITLVPTFRQEGLGEFCLKDIPIPAEFEIKDGMNATLQVVTNGDPAGGLYNCADLTFTTSTVPPPPSCANGTGVAASPFPSEAAARNANESTPQGQAQQGEGDGSDSGDTGDGTGSGGQPGGSGSSNSTSTTPSAAAQDRLGWASILSTAAVAAAALLGAIVLS